MKACIRFAAWFCLSALCSRADDVLTLKNGARKLCEVVGVEEGDIIIHFQPIPELPPITLRYPQSQISSIEFGQHQQLETMLRESTVTKTKELQSLWNRFSPLLGFAGSPSSRIGCRLGILYLETPDKELLQEALEIFSRIANESTDLVERESAQQGKLRAWTALGRCSDAIVEAQRILARPSGPNVCAEARVVLADAMARDLGQLLQDNPRWDEDEAAGKERTRLYHEALDLYLLASLLPDVAPHLAARGLWGALSIHVKCDASSSAAETALDLIAFFPDTTFGVKAVDFLSKLPPETPKNQEARLNGPKAPPRQDTAPENNSYDPQNPTVSSETTLDTSVVHPKRRKRHGDRSQ